MDSEQYKTPQKIFDHHHSPIIKFLNKNSHHLATGSTPRQSRLFQRTTTTPRGLAGAAAGNRPTYNILPILTTPPAKRFPKVVNPFEAALTDRLHLPIICSPSLFQRPATPQHSSTQFEWTIDDVSSLGPANVEPHETQFNDSPDPDVEAKAQAAISSYFKEQKIVPSPLVDCHMRSQRIILAEITGNTPVSKPGRRIRDGVAQTVLTLPPVLPADIEAALKPFFSYHENQQQSPSVKISNCDNSMVSIDHDARDASLRRKLFDFQNYHDEDTLDEGDILEVSTFSPPPKSPELGSKSLNESLNKSSFGSLSPISKVDNLSPNKRKSSFLDMSTNAQLSPISKMDNISPNKRKSSFLNMSSNAQFSPIPVVGTSSSSANKFSYRLSKNASDVSCDLDSTHKSSTPPDMNFSIRRSSSPALGEMSVDSSFNGKISRLVVNSSNCVRKSKSLYDVDVFEEEDDEDEMQVSQLSSKSVCSSNSSTHLNTPRGKRRSANRKNLSQSFSFHCSDDDEDEKNDENDLGNPSKVILSELISSSSSSLALPTTNDTTTAGRSIFYRTDSGFNEMTSTQDELKFNEAKKSMPDESETKVAGLNTSIMGEDVSMISCSTPSKYRLVF